MIRNSIIYTIIFSTIFTTVLAQSNVSWTYTANSASLTGTVIAGKSAFPPVTTFTDTAAQGFSFNISLVANNTADLALYCSDSSVQDFPSPETAQYTSDRLGTGQETIFISPQHIWPSGPPLNVECIVADNSIQEGEATQFVLTVELVSNVTMVPEELDAALLLYDSCCPSDCPVWDDMMLDAEDDLDLCNMKGSLCNSQGQLKQLDLTGVGLECKFPSDIFARFPALQALYLANNNMTGRFEELSLNTSALPDLEELVLSGNSGIAGVLSSTESAGVCSMTKRLRRLEVADAGVGGSVPSCLFDTNSTLVGIQLSSNQLTGSLPVFGVTNLQRLQLKQNTIAGAVPVSLAAHTKLQLLDLSENRLEGDIPDGWQPSRDLRLLSLASNQLTGPVPLSLAGHATLQELDLSNNLLDAWIAQPARTAGSGLTHISVAMNNLTGTFPGAVLAYPSLVYLNMSMASLQGELPEVREGELQGLHFLDLSQNSLTGSIPDSWASMGVFTKPPSQAVLNQFNLSLNSLGGNIPDWLALSNLTVPVAVSLRGNSFLNDCDPEFANTGVDCTGGSPSPAPLPVPPSPGQSPPPAPPPPPGHSGTSGLSGGAIAGIVISVLVACAIVAGLVVYIRSVRHSRTSPNIWDDDDFTRPPPDLELSGQAFQQPQQPQAYGRGMNGMNGRQVYTLS